MNKKGFTLVELLAVITILGVVMMIGTISITGIKNKMDQNMFENKLDFVLKAARSYGQDNQSKIALGMNATIGGKAVTYKLVPIGDLISSEDLEADETDDDGNKSINHYIDKVSINNLKIAVYVLNNRIYTCIPVDDSIISGTSNNASILFKGQLQKESFANQNLFCS